MTIGRLVCRLEMIRRHQVRRLENGQWRLLPNGDSQLSER